MVRLRTEFVYFSGGEIVSFFPSWLTPGGNSSCSSTWDLVLALITDTTCFFSPPSGKSSEFAKMSASQP